MFHSQGYQRDLMASNITSVVSTVAYQASPSMGFSRQKYWSGLPFPPPGDLPDPGVKTCVSCIGRQILYHQATREALCVFYCNLKIGKNNQSTWLFLYIVTKSHSIFFLVCRGHSAPSHSTHSSRAC